MNILLYFICIIVSFALLQHIIVVSGISDHNE